MSDRCIVCKEVAGYMDVTDANSLCQGCGTARYEAADKRVTELEAREAVILDVLEELRTWQNGSPLPSYDAPWQKAIDATDAILKDPLPAAAALLRDAADAKRYRKALEFYGHTKNWHGKTLYDQGDIARDALGAAGAGNEGGGT